MLIFWARNEKIVNNKAILTFLFEFEDGTFEFAGNSMGDGVSMNVIAVTSRRDVEMTICSYRCPRNKLGSALILIIIILFSISPGAC